MIKFAKGNSSSLPKIFNPGGEESMDNMVEALTSALVQQSVTVARKVSIPFETVTDFRINYIAKNCNVSFTSIVLNLIEYALPVLEQRLDISEAEIIENYNKDLPAGELPLISLVDFEKMVDEKEMKAKEKQSKEGK